MSNHQSWVKDRITQAKKSNSMVAESVTSRMEELLNGQLSEQLLTKAELTTLAKELVAAMNPLVLDVEAKQ